jgi:hypothetical protein
MPRYRPRDLIVSSNCHHREDYHACILLSLLWLLAGPALAQDKLVGTNMDVRTILNFKVADAAIQKLLPPGGG